MEKQRWEESEEKRVRGKKMQVREKVEKSRLTMFFHGFVAPGGRKVGSLKRRVRSHLWPDKRWKTARPCGAKHISKSKCTKHTMPEHFWKLRCRKSARRCGAKHISVQNTTCLLHFWRFRCGFAWQAQGILHFAKSEEKTWWFCSSFKNVGRRGTSEEDLEKCIRVAGAIQETCSSEMLGGQSADFLGGFAIWSIRSSGLLRWLCAKGATLGMTWPHFFVPGAIL